MSLGTRCDKGQRVVGFLIVQLAARALNYITFQMLKSRRVGPSVPVHIHREVPLLTSWYFGGCMLPFVGVCNACFPSYLSFIQLRTHQLLAPSALQGATLALRVLCREKHNEFVSFPGLPLLYPVEDMGPVASILWSDLLS